MLFDDMVITGVTEYLRPAYHEPIVGWLSTGILND
jgi:hypothetical protein